MTKYLDVVRQIWYNTGNFISSAAAMFKASSRVSNQGVLDYYDYLTARFGNGRIRHIWTSAGLPTDGRIQTNCRNAAGERANGKASCRGESLTQIPEGTSRSYQDEERRPEIQSRSICRTERHMSLVQSADAGQIRGRSYQAVDQGRNERSIEPVRLSSEMQSEQGHEGSQTTSVTLKHIINSKTLVLNGAIARLMRHSSIYTNRYQTNVKFCSMCRVLTGGHRV